MNATIEETSVTNAPIVVPRFSRETTVVGESGWGWEADPEDTASLTIAWDPELERTTATGLPTEVDRESGWALQGSLEILSGVIGVHELSAKLETNHPTLLSERLRFAHVPFDPENRGSLDAWFSEYPEMEQDWMSPTLALFAQDADPLEPGTPFLFYRTPHMQGFYVGWAVRLSGGESDVAFARWDDRDGVQALVDMVLSYDAELGSTLVNLSEKRERETQPCACSCSTLE